MEIRESGDAYKLRTLKKAVRGDEGMLPSEFLANPGGSERSPGPALEVGDSR